nr:hypothetical protein NNDYNQYS_NNDYNQYS_CDS_0008 [Microvirus sp.]CAI9752251.1 hypothetical protein HGHZXEWH_HGHZXEWH_CDS_0008 [Microvirus sp.]
MRACACYTCARVIKNTIQMNNKHYSITCVKYENILLPLICNIFSSKINNKVK